tara:strand:+ start:235 stop:459 length:225 start_codon:yes stop_codon:yes gene_type:complete
MIRVLPLLVLCSCSTLGFGLKDITASISANACIEGKVELNNGEIDASLSVDACAKAEALGIPLEVCAGWEHGTQ